MIGVDHENYTRLGATSMLHTLSASPLLDESDFKQVEPTAEDEVVASGAKGTSVPDAFFSATGSKFSLGGHRLEEYTRQANLGKHPWTSPSAERFAHRSAALRALLTCQGELMKLRRAWQSRLAVPGTLLFKETDTGFDGGYVLGITDFTVTVWPGEVEYRTGFQHFVLSSKSDDWQQFPLLNYEGWKCREVECLPPSVCASRFPDATLEVDAFTGIILALPAGPAQTLLQVSARYGFKTRKPPTPAAPSAAPKEAASSSKHPIPCGDHDLSEARHFLPAAAGCTLSLHKGVSWQAKYLAKPTPPRSYTETWRVDEGGLTRRDALLRALTWAWYWHKEVTGEESPWTLAVGFDATAREAKV